MRGRTEIQFHLPVLNRLLFAILFKSFLNAFFNPQGAAGGVRGAVSEEAFGKFIVGVALAAFLELRDPPEMPGGVVEFAEFDDLVVVLVILFLKLFFF